MSTQTSDDAIYFVELADKRPRGTRNVREALYYVETATGKWRTCVFTEEDIRAGIRAHVPYGPRPVPPKDMINFVGVGSGFAPNTPRMRVELRVSEADAERPLGDIHGGSWFRSGAWIVTDEAKAVLRGCDPEGFECLLIITEFLQNGDTLPAPNLWLCELVRFVNALDDVGQRLLPLAREAKLAFNAGAIGALPFFHEASLPSDWIFCTEVGRRAIVDAGLTGLKFEMWGRQHD